ncbi:MAG: methyl-accepting chemotaxis protein [Pseudomonadota bacterium]
MFRENAHQVERSNAEKEQLSEANRAARKAMMAELEASFGQVVEAAVQGDFSQRIDQRFDDATLATLAEGINRLMDSMNEGLGATKNVLAQVAQGQLGVRMEGMFSGAFGELQDGLNGTISQLSDLVIQITDASSDVKTGAAAITDGATSLATASERQASSLEETSAAMEEMSESTNSNAKNAAEASKVASGVSDQADKAVEMVDQTIAAMSDIQEGAREIANIVGVIDGIAFQTNLLALNAAVEAARAGEAGKGFAVVASEVRSLAQRASEAANDIRTRIEHSSGQVEGGVSLVEDMGQAISGMLSTVRTVSETMQTITEASQQQAQALSEITVTVAGLDQITQQNAAMADRNASTARNLGAGAVTLEQLVSSFSTGQGNDFQPADAA